MFTNTRLTTGLSEDFLREIFELPAKARHDEFISSKRLSIDITDDNLFISLSVPGYDEASLEIKYENDKIMIKSLDTDKFNTTTKEIAGVVDEVLKIGKDWDGSKADASVRNGILFLSIPKYEDRKPKTISFKKVG